MVVFFIWLVLAALVGICATTKGRDGIGFFLLSIFLSPLIGFVIVLMVSNKHRVECSMCREMIKIGASVCPFCKTELEWEVNMNRRR